MSALLIWDDANDYRMTPLSRVQEGRDMSGKVVVITGATGALGKATSLALYHGGAHVVATGRNLARTQKVCDALLKEEVKHKTFVKKEGGSLEGMELDMGSYESIQKFVKTLTAKYSKVDVLINNAGVIPFKEFTESKEGLEITYATNFASVVVLTELLLPSMASDGRIVNISSMSHADGANPNNWDAVPSTKETFGGYDKDYCESKWLVTAYGYALSQRLAKDPKTKGMAVLAADPGVSPDSAMWDNVVPIKRYLVKYVFKFLTKTSDQAAACGVNCAVKQDVENGGYYSSGVLDPVTMRADCRDAAEWNKAAAILKAKLPKDLAKLVHET
ncbi:MAG: hypothetical protein SGBAC_011103 [Bacillariaceae sp.]